FSTKLIASRLICLRLHVIHAPQCRGAWKLGISVRRRRDFVNITYLVIRRSRTPVVPKEHEIRANFDRDSITVYQAYSAAIAEVALKAGRFVSPFSFHRMTWIKPSFLWLMHRSNWGQKSGQERTLAVRIKRSGWEKALSLTVLTAFDPSVHPSPEEWREQ